MKPTCSAMTFATRAILGLLALVSPALAQEVVENYYDDVVIDDRLPAQVDPYIAAIQRATDPSAAVAAYTRGQSLAPNSLLLEQAYVHRLAELGAPELGATQARDLVQRALDDGVAWAVVAVDSARREDFAAALAAIGNAVQRAPDDAFVQGTAGQLLAWYDTGGAQSQLPAAVREAVHDVRAALAGRSGYAGAYREARSYYDSQQGGEPTSPSPAPVAPQPTYVAPAPVPVEPVYTDPYVNTYVYPYGTYWGSGYVYPGWSGAVYIGSRYVVRRPFIWTHADRHDDHRYYRRDWDDHRRANDWGNRGGGRGDDRRGDSWNNGRGNQGGDRRSDGGIRPGGRSPSGDAGNRNGQFGRTPDRRSAPLPGNRAPSGSRTTPTSRFDGAGRPTQPLWANSPGAKPGGTTPGLKPPVSPGGKAPAAPGVKAPAAPRPRPGRAPSVQPPRDPQRR